MSVAAAIASLSKTMTKPTCSRASRASAVTGIATATAYPAAGTRRRHRLAAAGGVAVSGDADNQGLREDAGGQAVLLTLWVAVDLGLDGVLAGCRTDRRGRQPDDLSVPSPVPAGEVGRDRAPSESALGGQDDAVEDAVVELRVGHQLEVALQASAVADDDATGVLDLRVSAARRHLDQEPAGRQRPCRAGPSTRGSTCARSPRSRRRARPGRPSTSRSSWP